MKKLFSIFLATAISICAVTPCYAYEEINIPADMEQHLSSPKYTTPQSVDISGINAIYE